MRAVLHAHGEPSRQLDARADDARLRRHGDQAADEQEVGAEFARLTVEDFSGSSEVLVFPEAWGLLHDRVRADVPVLMKGGYSRRDQGADNPTFIVESVTQFAEMRTNGQVAVAIDLGRVARDRSRGDGGRARRWSTSHPGTAPLELRWNDGNGTRARLRSRSLSVSPPTDAALTELRALLGDERVSVV